MQRNIARHAHHARGRALALSLITIVTLGACEAAAGANASDATSTYGDPVSVGLGTVRSYVTTKNGAPTEIGVALSERALEGLPTTGVGHHGGGQPIHQFNLDLPAGKAPPFKFVEVNWNPTGHEPEGVYSGFPHFDFHFYTVSRTERDAIVPSDPQYAAHANALPTGDYVPPFTVQLGPPGASPAEVAVPMMGVHWSDVRSPELQQLMGKPEAYRPFTSTFIIGSWNGRFHFWEPMITRAHMLAKKTTTDPAVRDQILPIAVPAKYQVPGNYPTAYRITWDPEAKEYRVALTGMTRRD